MNQVPQRPRGANVDRLSTDRVLPLRAPKWEDPAEGLAWFGALRAVVGDLAAAGEDATRPKGGRVLSRAEARRRIEEAEHAVLVMLDTAELSFGRGPGAP